MRNRNAFGLLIALFLFGACATYNNARKYYDKHPQAFARDCAGSFVAKDSIGEKVIEFIPGNSADYSEAIDSLNNNAIELIGQLKKDSISAASVSQECAKIVAGYQCKVVDLSRKIRALNETYKNRTPDTFKIEIPTFRIPYQTIAQIKYQSLAIDSLQNVISNKMGQIEAIKKASKTKTYWIIALSIAVAAGVILKFKNII